MVATGTKDSYMRLSMEVYTPSDCLSAVEAQPCPHISQHSAHRASVPVKHGYDPDSMWHVPLADGVIAMIVPPSTALMSAASRSTLMPRHFGALEKLTFRWTVNHARQRQVTQTSVCLGIFLPKAAVRTLHESSVHCYAGDVATASCDYHVIAM